MNIIPFPKDFGFGLACEKIHECRRPVNRQWQCKQIIVRLYLKWCLPLRSEMVPHRYHTTGQGVLTQTLNQFIRSFAATKSRAIFFCQFPCECQLWSLHFTWFILSAKVFNFQVLINKCNYVTNWQTEYHGGIQIRLWRARALASASRP